MVHCISPRGEMEEDATPLTGSCQKRGASITTQHLAPDPTSQPQEVLLLFSFVLESICTPHNNFDP